jgi:hypothetical protein
MTAATETERARYRWPKEEEAAIYVLSLEARDTDCKTVPKVSLTTEGAKVRALSWTPKVNCAPPNSQSRPPSR